MLNSLLDEERKAILQAESRIVILEYVLTQVREIGNEEK